MNNRVLALAMIACVGVAQAQTDFYTNVTNLWYQGDKSNVFALANARLIQNSNDIAGLVLKMECECAWLDLPQISNSILRVIQIGDIVSTSNFVQKFQVERQELLDDLELFRTYPTPQELPIERGKANIIHKELPTYLFDALQKDGYFD
jgi:hypothetical protein